MKYKLPKGFSCKHCVIQWYWATANSCNPPGFAEYFEKYPMPGWGKCPGDGGAFGGRNPTMAKCGGSKFPEEFWMCADVRITGDGVGLPAIMPRAGKGEPKWTNLLSGATTAAMADLPKDDDDASEAPTPAATITAAASTEASNENPSPSPQATSTPMPAISEKPSVETEMPLQVTATPASTPEKDVKEKKAEPVQAGESVSAPVGCGMAAAPATCVKEWGQCGGKTHNGLTECCDKDAKCVKYNDWHSMCVKAQHGK